MTVVGKGELGPHGGTGGAGTPWAQHVLWGHSVSLGTHCHLRAVSLVLFGRALFLNASRSAFRRIPLHPSKAGSVFCKRPTHGVRLSVLSAAFAMEDLQPSPLWRVRGGDLLFQGAPRAGVRGIPSELRAQLGSRPSWGAAGWRAGSPLLALPRSRGSRWCCGPALCTHV